MKGKQDRTPKNARKADAMEAKARTRKELYAAGKGMRRSVPRRSHAVWKAPANRFDPMNLLIKSSQGRIPELIPIRYGRMLQTPFTFYRGAAAIMSADLANTPVTGVRVQICGDCHLLNFGGFATPERRIVFDINDFDETLPAPWEWDVKRLAASFVIASRNNNLSAKAGRNAAAAAVRAYREKMAELAEMPALEAWYSVLDVEGMKEHMDQEWVASSKKRLEKELSRTIAEVDYPKLVEHAKGRPTIKDNPPLIYHLDIQKEAGFDQMIQKIFQRYRDSLPEERRVLFDRYHLGDVAVKVVGVGSVGTFCGIALFFATDDDPLFLQAKEARPSVLEPYVGKSTYKSQGQRVVAGQRLMQAASDIFLGWTQGERGRDFYIRQLRDVKIKPKVEAFDEQRMVQFAFLCGWALARAHARSGNSALLAGYMGKSDAFDDAIADFAVAYSDQNELDHAALVKAVRSGRIEAVMER